jgi:hypothetical protein
MAGVWFLGRARFSSSPHCPNQLWSHTVSYPMGIGEGGGVISPGVSMLWYETDHSHPSNAEAKNGGAIPSLSHMSAWHSA